jgi:hypothetical protein
MSVCVQTWPELLPAQVLRFDWGQVVEVIRMCVEARLKRWFSFLHYIEWILMTLANFTDFGVL